MTKATLIRKSDGAVVGGVIDTSRPQWVLDPLSGKRLASPAVVGWENNVYRLVEFQPVEPAPDGKRVVSRWSAYDDTKDKVVETAVLEDARVSRPLVPRRAIVDRLNAAGLLEAARAALDAAPLYDRERWNSRDYIYADDSTAVALIRSIGGDPATILGPEE